MFGFGKNKQKEVTLDDVTPAHPDEYRGKALRSRLDARRERLREIHSHSHSEGFEDVSLEPGNE
jgi:hypothetical protein